MGLSSRLGVEVTQIQRTGQDSGTELPSPELLPGEHRGEAKGL